MSLLITKLKDLLLSHEQSTNLEARETPKFHKIIHSHDQKVRKFILDLQTQTSTCNFDDYHCVQMIQPPKYSFQQTKEAFINYEAVIQVGLTSMKISNAFIRHTNQLHCQGCIQSRYIDNGFRLRENTDNNKVKQPYKVSDEGELRFGQ